jgi:hypothetical protein
VEDSSEIRRKSQDMAVKRAELLTREKFLEEKSRYLGYCVAYHQKLLQ